MRVLMRQAVSFVLVSFSALGCANDNTFDGGGVTEVVEIVAEDSSIPLGDGGVIGINFLFDENDVIDDGGQVNLIVRLPRELSYRDNSAEIDKSGSRDRDVDPRVRRCQNGVTFLVFEMGKSQLEGAQPPFDGGDAQLKFTVNGEKRGQMVSIEAAADENGVQYSCTRDFVFDEQEIVSVE